MLEGINADEYLTFPEEGVFEKENTESNYFPSRLCKRIIQAFFVHHWGTKFKILIQKKSNNFR